MASGPSRVICWTPAWNKSRVGLEHLLLTEHAADSVVLAIDDERGPFRLAYRLAWNEAWLLHSAGLAVSCGGHSRSLSLRSDGHGHWHDGRGQHLATLDGCMDIDIWPTPFTNSFPILRGSMVVGERRQFRVVWVFGPDLTIRPQAQAYTRLDERLYLFENLDGSGFKAELPVDEGGIVLDYPELFMRVKTGTGSASAATSP